jgi:hypothetical protein
MESIRIISKTIGLNIYMNCVLVRDGLRNAMLIQPADYNEAISTDPKTASKLRALKKAFPTLVQSDIRGETLISKKVYADTDIKTDADMGAILGFPCAGEFRYTLDHPDEPKTGINIDVNLKSGVPSEQIVAYMCKDDKTYNDALAFAAKAETILKADAVVGKIVESVSALKNTMMPPKYLIHKLLSNKPLADEDKHQIVNYIWNLSLENSPNYNFDFKNPVHRGILIGLLSIYDNNPLSPFYPLQYRPEGVRVDEITAKWDSALHGIFAAAAAGGKRGTRKTKRRN